MSSDIAIKVEDLSKCYQIYENPGDRLKQFLFPRLRRLLRIYPKNYFREFWALKNISFEIKRGEIIGIIGRNGSGKSTLLQMICGTLSPTTGTIFVNGRVAALLELGSGFNPEFTGRENVYFNGAILGLSKDEINGRLDKIVDFADIGEFIDRPVKTYSSGMYVRLAFAVVAHVDADILIIDEALAVGDAFFTQKCMRFLRSFMETGTILFVSHDTGSIKNLCSHVFWLDKGLAMQEGLPKDVCNSYLEAYYQAQQITTRTKNLSTNKNRISLLQRKDQRASFINGSNLRNDLKIFEFNSNASSFGKGGAQITRVELLDDDSTALAWVVGGEQVSLQIQAVAHDAIDAPIIGFFLKDRLGQYLFGDNTYLSNKDHPVFCEKGKEIKACFTFVMPILPPGDYSFDLAIASGTQDDHIQHHWIYDALLIKSESSSIATGLIGIPMAAIDLEVIG